MSNRTNRIRIFYVIGILALMIAVPACSPTSSQTEEPAAPKDPVATLDPIDVPPTAEPPTVSFDSVSFSFGPEIASSWTVEYVPEGPSRTSSAGPVAPIDPEHIIFSLENYLIPPPRPESLHRALIFIYPLVEMAEQNLNLTGAHESRILQTYLESPPENLMDQSQAIPFLPLINAAQVFHTQVKFLDFQNGKGVRYLTMYSQGPMPIVNAGIIYTFQGLTNDGKNYIAAYLPVNHPGLKMYANEVMDTEGDAFLTDALNYINGISEQLDRQPSYTFTPDLAALDAMIETFLVRP